MVFICIAIVLFWKVFKKTKFLRGTEVDLTSDLQDINDYTEEVRKATHIPVHERIVLLIFGLSFLVPRARGSATSDLLDQIG